MNLDESLKLIEKLRTELGRVLVGQDGLVEGLLCGLLTGGHVLLEGNPGLGKTLAVRTLATCLGGSFSRIQFTPDLLPSDVTGIMAYRPETSQYEVRLGPLNANLVLADEINRAPAKVQSALLEAMQEGQVSIGGRSYRLPEPFLVVATQNPIEQSGTYALPEAQKDRFQICIRLDYPSREEELRVMERMGGGQPTPSAQQVLPMAKLLEMRPLLDEIHVDRRIQDYILDLVVATRPGEGASLSPLQKGLSFETDKLIEIGASPRASLSLLASAKALALLSGRGYLLPDDVRRCAVPVLAHRVVPSFEAEARKLKGVDLIQMLVTQVVSP